jgi:tetratricopeptide (TPR) repeat protein
MNRKKVPLLLYALVVLLLLTACSGAEDRKDRHFNRGMELFEQGNYVKARLEFKNVLQIDPKEARAYYMSGQIEEKEQNWERAYALFLRTVELDPKLNEAQVHLGRLYALSGQPEKALEAAAVALDINPNDSTALALKGLARLRMGEKDTAISELKAALELDPKNLDALSLLSTLYADQGQMDKAIALAKQGLDQHPDRIASYLLVAQLYERSGNVEGTLGILQKIIQLEPDEIQHRVRLASYYLDKQQASKAEQVLQRAVKDLPENIDAKLALVELLNRQDNKSGAEAALKAFVAEAPDTYSLQLALAHLYAQTDRKGEAESVLRQVIEQADRSEDGVEARVRLAKLLITEKSEDQALKLVEDALKLHPKEKEALLLRAAIFLANNDLAGSIADLRTLLKEDPTNVKAYRLKARVHLKKNEIALARQSLEDAIKAQPQEAAANYELVNLLLKSGKRDEALTVLEKMRRYVPDDIKVLVTLSQLYSQNQNWGEVEKLADSLMAKHPENASGYFYAGLVHQQNGQHLEAITAFEKSLVIKPNAVEPLIGLAKSQIAIDQPAAALQRVQKVIEINPDHLLALNLEGEILLAQKRNSEAEAIFNQVIELNPEWVIPYNNLLKIKQFEEDESGVRAILEKGFEKTHDPRLGIILALNYEKTGDNEEAREVYEKLLQREPGFALAANNLAMLLLKSEPDQSALDKALELVKKFELSENPFYLDTLGWTYLKRGEPGLAVPVLERAVRTKGSVPEIDYHLGIAYHQLGRTADAVEKLKSATAPESQFAGMEEAKALLEELQ